MLARGPACSLGDDSMRRQLPARQPSELPLGPGARTRIASGLRVVGSCRQGCLSPLWQRASASAASHRGSKTLARPIRGDGPTCQLSKATAKDLGLPEP